MNRLNMDSDADDTRPIVPHNSVIDCRLPSSASRPVFTQRGSRKDTNVYKNKGPQTNITDGKAAIESLKSRLYDGPENSDVYKTVLRPPLQSGEAQSKVPHPPSMAAQRSATAFRTTMFRRDFNRIQMQRSQIQSKQASQPKQWGRKTLVPMEEVPKVPDTGLGEIPPQLLAGPTRDKVLDDANELLQSAKDEISSLPLSGTSRSGLSSASSQSSDKPSRPFSGKSDSDTSHFMAPSSSACLDTNHNPLTPPRSYGLPDDDLYLGLDVMDVIRKLRSRLKRSTDLEAIANGIDLDNDENNLQKLYIKEDDGKFLYCLPKNRELRAARYKPYDLVCVTSEDAQKYAQYFTVTSSAVTQVKNGYDSDITLMERWLYERKMFNRIYEMFVFGKFRIWKAFTTWKNNVRFHKNSESKEDIKKTLFSVEEISQAAILKIRALCENASSSITGVGSKDDGISFYLVENQVTFSLEEFCATQTKQVEKAKEQLLTLRRKALEIVKEACEKIVEKEGLVEWIHPERKKLQEEPKFKADKKDPAIADKEDPAKADKKDPAKADVKAAKEDEKKPSFTQMAQWRGVLHRITRFIRVIDLLLMELLRRLVLVGLRTLAAQLQSSCVLGPPVQLSLMETTEEEQILLRLKKTDSLLNRLEKQSGAEAAALFRVALVLNVPERTDADSKSSGQKKFVTFQDDASSPQPEEDETKSSRKSSLDSPPEIATAQGSIASSSEVESSSKSTAVQNSDPKYPYITMSPTHEEFENGLLNVIYGFELAAASFKSLVRDKELAVYTTPPGSDVVFALSRDVEEEEKAQKVPWPDTELLFGEDADYQSDVSHTIQLVKDEADSVLNYAKKFRRFCKMVDRSRGVDVDGSLKEREWNTEEFYSVLNLHTEQVLEMNDMVLVKRVGLFSVETDGFQQASLPFPQKVLSAVGRHLPVIAARRNDALLTVIKHASRKLDKTPESVEDFVEHLVFLARMASDITSLEREYVIVTRLYSIARNFDLPIPPEELALYQMLMPSFQHLKSTILYCEAKRDENIQRFTRELEELISNVRRELVVIKNKVRSPILLEADNIPQVTIETLKFLSEELEAITTKAKSYASYQERFCNSMSATFQKKALVEGKMVSSQGSAQAVSLQTEVTEVDKDLALRRLLWEATQEWQGLVEQWEATPFDLLSTENVQKDVTRFIQTVYLLEKGLPPNRVVPRLKQRVTSFKLGMPVITSLRNPALRTRHWEAVQDVIGTRLVRDKYFTLGNLLQLNVFQHKEKISEISSQASNEATLELMLQKVMDFWNYTDFNLKAHSSRDIAVIAGADDIITALEESQVTLANIRGSRFVTPIKALVEEWDRKLHLFSRTLDEWLMCQRNWLYLETIFTAADIQRQLPNEARLFAQVDKSWRDIMRRTIDKPNAVKAATAAGVLEVLQASNFHLEKIHRCLEDYLETKRLVFSRFYFLSNEDLLDILANNKNPNAVQPHLRKCFDNIHQLEIVRQAHSPPQIQFMISEEGETVNLPKTLRARGNVESWLLNVENAMYETVKLHFKTALSDLNNTSYTNWVLGHPGQAILTVSQINFNRNVLACFRTLRPKDSLQSMREKLVLRLTTLSQLVTSLLPLHKRQLLESLLTLEVHGREVLDLMISNHVASQEDFDWIRQLRYEWRDDQNACVVCHCDAVFDYGYEYLGCSSRLVITPLTDRCFLTLTGALNLHLNGAPSGPAGTGKTETVKDLAKALGKHCLVFNCSEELDYKMMGKFFSGVAQSGSWICFDEFNRIDVEVLSVIAQQLHSIKLAKDNNATRFLFEGRDIKMTPSCGVFITMNPGYAGRVELPDNLKSLFRPVAMMIPDYALIAEIILFSEGFTTAAMLSRKVYNLYQLASKQLSQQDHYDFGLRAIKSVLLMAGQQRSESSQQSDSEDLEQEEAHIIMNAVKKANIPKFVAADVPLFEGILADLFPGITPPSPDNATLERAVRWSLMELNIQYWPSQVDKIVQIYHTILVRHGVMLVGPAGGGKTTARQILKRALVLLPLVQSREQHEKPEVDDILSGKNSHSIARSSKLRKGKVELSSLNPKCVTVGELYGEFNPSTMEWTDGLLSSVYRRFAKESNRGSEISKKIREERAESRATTPASSRPYSARSYTTTVSGVSGDDQSEETTLGADESQMTSLEEAHPREGTRNWYWLVMDGPVDTLWVESLNTVLDDSKLLCLSNGERIGMGPGMRLMFEVDHLAMASPATVSRCGMVYMEPEELGWKPYVRTWIQKLKDKSKIPSEASDHLLLLFESSVERGLQFVRQYEGYQHIPAPPLSMICTLCGIISGFFDLIMANGGFNIQEQTLVSEHQAAEAPASESGSSKVVTFVDDAEQEMRERRTSYVQRNPTHLLTFLGKVYVFAFTWAFGGTLDLHGDGDGEEDDNDRSLSIREVFDTFVRDLFMNNGDLSILLPAGQATMFAYYIDMETGNFARWDLLVPATRTLIAKSVSNQYAISDTLNTLDDPPPLRTEYDVDRSLVPTVDTVRYAFLVALMAMNKHPVLLTGESGVGKSTLLYDTLARLASPGGTGLGVGAILGSVFRGGGSNFVESLMEVAASGPRMTAESTVTFEKIQFSAHTTASRTRTFIESRLVKRGRDVLGPRPGKKLILFVDDLNMPQPDEYSSQPPLELLRQVMDAGGFYDAKKLLWKELRDVTLLTACSPPGGGRSTLNNRLLRHFSMLCLPHPSTKWLRHIYNTQLGRFLEKVDFTREIRDSRECIVSVAMGLYFNLSVNLLPTPAKTHYTFNLRDLSKLIEGMLQAHPTIITIREHFAQLLAHEASRVFHDRLINQDDRAYFYDVLSKQLHLGFKVRWEPEMLQDEPIMYGDFFDTNMPHGTRIYRLLSNYDRVLHILQEYYDKAKLSSGNMEQRFVFFDMAVQHVARAARVFRHPGSHMMLVGVGGTGKVTVVRLAAFIQDCRFIKPQVSRVYQRAEFWEDIKKAYFNAGIKGESTVLFLTDSVAKDMFLEDVSSILSTGEVPNMFDHEDYENIFLELKGEVLRSGIQDTKEATFNFFIHRVRKKLHVVISTSPVGPSFRQRCRLYPSLINCCTIDWYDKWPQDALRSVAVSYLESMEFEVVEVPDKAALKRSLASAFVQVHQDVEDDTDRFYKELQRLYYTTPTSYIEFVHIFMFMFHEKASQISSSRKRLATGLQKLSESNALVSTMQAELIQLGPKLEQKAKDTEKLLEQLARDQKAVDQVHSVVQKEEEFMNKEAMRVQAIADEAQRDLDNAIPQLQLAISALDALDKSDISEIRVYTKPPAMVMTVLAAVCTLLQQKPDWNTAKLLLGDQGFLKKLVNYDKNSVPDKVFVRLKKYTQHPEFNPDNVGKISVACRSMCQWVLALENYADVYKMVAPKQKRCEESQAALAMAKENLRLKQASLNKIQDQLNILQRQYDDSVQQLEELKVKKNLTLARLDRASVLTTALAEEQIRWNTSLEEVAKQCTGLLGDTFVSAAAVTYLGAFTSSYRSHLIMRWIALCNKESIPVGREFELSDVLSEKIEIQKWLNDELPHDKHSVENAVIMKHCRRWPLLIDPQEQAVKWIMQREKSNGLKVVKATDPNYLRALEDAIPLGDPVLIEDVGEQLDPSLNPILTKNIILQGNMHVIRMGETDIEYNENFRLYLTTPLANPHFLPDVCIKSTIINFTVTLEGLQDQLLSRTVMQENPKLEEDRRETLVNLVNDRSKVRELEDRSLSLLNSSRGNILDDEDLITTLDESEKMAHVIQQRVDLAEHTEESINASREKYLPVAARGAILYFVLTDLSSLDVMYQFSLPWFTNLFANCVESSKDVSAEETRHSPVPPGSAGTLRPYRKANTGKRLSIVQRAGFKRRMTVSRPKDDSSLSEYLTALVDLITENVYRVVSHALFARHKLTFSFMLCTSILMQDKWATRGTLRSITEEEWIFFLRGSTVAAISDRIDIDKEDDPLDAAGKGSATQARGSLGQLINKMNKPPAKWISASMWKECLQISNSLPAFSGLCSNMAVNIQFWRNFANTENPMGMLESGEGFVPPQTVEGRTSSVGWLCTSLTRFQRLMLVKILRPECLIKSVRQFVEEEMGTKFITTVGFDLQEMYDESNARTPLIFILSPGSDPASQLLRFAHELRGTTLHLDMISLGRGQGPRAEEVINKAYQQKGKWVFLQNCQHAASFMPRLQQIIRRISHSETQLDPQFRMWLSSKPDPSFPVSILQAGLKMTVEPPPGVKSNLLRTFGAVGGAVTEAVFEDPGPGPAWRRLLFGLCLFNSLVHERKKFNALGWNIPYEFTTSDLEVSIQMLHMMLTEHRDVPWDELCYLTGDIAYGGRVTDQWDQRCLKSLLTRFYNPSVLNDDYAFTEDLVYRPPPPNISLSVCCTYIEGLPATDSPELFGMNHNAAMVYLGDQAKNLVSNLLAGQPKVAFHTGSSKKTSDGIILELAADIMSRLPIAVGLPPDSRLSTDSRPHSSPGSRTSPLNRKQKYTRQPVSNASTQSTLLVVLDQELNRIDRLLQVIHTSLSSLRQAVKGTLVMSEALEQAFEALLNNQVPLEWKKHSYESCKPLGSWVDNLVKRVDFFACWLELVPVSRDDIARGVREGSVTPSAQAFARQHPRAYWLPAFFHPQAFLTAVLQTHSRMRNVPLDSLAFEYKVRKACWTTEEVVYGEPDIDFRRASFTGNATEEGTIVYGLYLDGASWDHTDGCLQEAPDGQRISPLPELHFVPYQFVSVESKDSKTNPKSDKTQIGQPPGADPFEQYECPIYRTSLRASSLLSSGLTTNFVTAVNLPSRQPSDHWITRGVALLCQLNE
ncbi:dynein axonemal heavy chain 6 isoform X3 [Nematostella vectensis]|uniref:dynein axonemal heavy chain 6 isoform X3 n=1 Tax=Nematostella vectensis TaxID=45351 RepID=UPI00207751CC|nr:dynein axonemal heavy chain 6 isoform X3 [Nematostella vectensis]